MIGRLQKSGMMRFGEGANAAGGQCRGQGAEAHRPQGSSAPAAKGRADEDSGMTRMGDMLSQSPADIAAMMRGRPGGKPLAGPTQGRRR